MKNIFIILLVVTTSFISTAAYGHGLGGEVHSPVSLDGRDVTLSVNISPSTFDSNDLERYIQIELSESKSKSIVEHVTFTLEMSKNGEQIFRRMFHDDLGNLVIKVINDNSDEIKIKGDKSPIIDAWMRTTTESVTMSGPIFDSGGLYEYKVEILTADSDLNFLDKRLELTGAISLAEHNTYEIIDSEKNIQEVNIVSYFDTINDFKFDSNKMTFSMPFDWNQDFEQLTVVHQEIRISKGFSDFLHTQYNAIVNDIQLKDAEVTIDDYSFEGRTVHIAMNKESLKQIKEQAKQKSDSTMYFELGPSEKVNLPLTAVTPDLRYRVYLSWEPEIIKTGEDVTFFLQTEELYTDKLNTNIEYELEISQKENLIFKEHVSGSVNSDMRDEFQFKFSPKNYGTIKLDMLEIEGFPLANVSFLVVVKPQETSPFPIKLESISESNSNGGRFTVDLTLFPNSLGLGESEFIITFYEKDTGLTVRDVTYDFVLIKDDSEIYRTSGFANAGGTFENFVFVEGETGDITLRIEKIAGTEEYVELSINVVPEFPIGVSIVFGMIIILIITISKTRHVKNFQITV